MYPAPVARPVVDGGNDETHVSRGNMNERMIIDIHGHYTTYPPGVEAYRGAQIAQMGAPTKGKMNVTDDEIRKSIEGGQLKLQRERGTDLTLFSPRASWMGHHFGNELISRYWTEHEQRSHLPRRADVPGQLRRRVRAAPVAGRAAGELRPRAGALRRPSWASSAAT